MKRCLTIVRGSVGRASNYRYNFAVFCDYICSGGNFLVVVGCRVLFGGSMGGLAMKYRGILLSPLNMVSIIIVFEWIAINKLRVFAKVSRKTRT